ncbi:alpha/beta hydrolase [Nocardiopsis deserti]|uniref:alpha/beta hydrolase n=1 Tax=Nocardiopsis deserti TaxID=2605988 RepID=UPI00123AB6AB|nr:alpha/beta hydrolase [Nocardiopsis deserti]
MPSTDAWVRQVRQAHTEEMARLPRPALARVRDLTVAGLPARLYLPDAAAVLPVLVYFHGGGWVMGDVESYDPVARTLSRACGAAVLSVDYRRPPEHPFPAAIDDAEAAVRWTAANAAALGLDASRMGVAGDSAGGQIAAAIALRLASSAEGPRLAAQLLVYPALDLRAAPGTTQGPSAASEAARRLLNRLFDLYMGPADRTLAEASPLLASGLEGLPATVVVTAEHDPLRQQGEEFARRTLAAGASTSLVFGRGLAHGFLGREPFDDPDPSITGRFGRLVHGALRAPSVP